MAIKKLRDKIKRINPKTLSILVLVILIVLSVVGIVLSSITFGKSVSKTHSKQLGNKLNINYDVNLLGNSKPNVNNQDVIWKASESMNRQLQNRNLQDYDLQYGLGKDELDIQNAYLYGNLNMSFNLADKELGFDQKLTLSKLDDPKVTSADKLNIASQLLTYFYRFNNNFNYRLQKNIISNIEKQNFTGNAYSLSTRKDDKNKPAVGNVATNNVDIKLLPRKQTDHKSYWNLNGFQTDFYTEFKESWEKEKDHKKVIDALDQKYEYKTIPTDSYIFWVNRSVLIARLQVAIMLTHLHEKFKGAQDLTSLELFLVNDLINNLTLDEKNFGYWVYKLNNQTNALFNLNRALEYDFSNSVEAQKDPLLELLSNYYTRQEIAYIPFPTKEQEESIGMPYTKPYEFLYSWKASKEKLINSYFIPIDYANFFKFFKNNNSEFKDSSPSDFINKEYYSSTFLLESSYFNGITQPKELAKIINDYSFEQSIFNRNLYNLQFHIQNQADVLSIAKKFINYISVVEQQNLVAPIRLPTYLSTFIGILVVILLIGIVVSIFYRVPGAIATVFSLLNFTLSTLLFNNLGLSFSIDTFLASGIFAVLSFAFALFYFDYFKEGIRKGYNIWNSFIYSFRKSFNINIRLSVTILIIGITFLIFGVTLFQSFGSMLVIISLMTICITGIGFALAFATFLFGITTDKFHLFLNNNYKEAIIKIQNSIYRNLVIEIPDHKGNAIYNKILTQFNVSWKLKQIWYLVFVILVSLLSLIGFILLGVIGFGLSSDFSKIYEIMIRSKTQLTDAQIALLASKLNLSIYNVKTDIANGVVINTLQILELKTSWSNFLNLINSTNFSDQELNALGFSNITSFINSLTVGSINNTSILELKDNLVKCLFISMGFVSIWVFLTLNIVNVIPVFILILFNLFIMLGVILAFRIPFDKYSLFSLATNYIFNTVMSLTVMSYIREGIAKRNSLSKDEIKVIIKTKSKNLLNLYLLIYVLYIVSNLIYLLFIANSFKFVLLLISVSSSLLMFVNIFLVANIVYWTSSILQLFAKEQQYKSILKYFSKQKDFKNENKDSKKYKSFDKVDEQEIYGINKFN